MKQRILSTVLALCLCLFVAPKAYAQQEPRAEAAGNLTEQQAYDRMIALKEDYPEGTPWTNSIPYTLSSSYNWNGSGIGVSGGVGCAAFAFILSDAAFGSLPATMNTTVKLSDVHVGDILRLNGGAHTVIVLQVNDAGVVIAEGNYNKTIHWGRTLSKAEVENATALITRYPGGQPMEDGSSPNEPMVDTAGKSLTGTLAGGLTWKLSKAGTLTISGTGAMPDYTETNGGQPWSAHLESILNIVIESGVTHIGNYAFYGCKAISATVSDGVKEIGSYAFRACTELHSVVLPASITTVGDGAFMSTGLTYASFDAHVTLGTAIFAQCQDLRSVSLPQNMTSIGDSMFSSCWRLSGLYIPKSVTEIAANAFTSCISLTDIYFGGSEAEWNALMSPQIRPTLSGKMIHYNEPLPSPFDTGDTFIPDGTGPDPDPDHTHTWDEGIITLEPTCTDGGIRTLTCTCSETRTSPIPALGHSYGAWRIVTPATASSGGLRERFCSRCNDRQVQDIPLAAAWENPYSDVGGDAWYYDAVRFSGENGLMSGYGDSLFGPDDNLTRAQLAQILYNREGKPAVTGISAFTDVASDAWYTPAITWATAQKVVEGYGSGLFGPDDDITREQLAVMLWRYVDQPGAAQKTLEFADAGKISDYAMEALQWAVEQGIVQGKGNGVLDPNGKATRAEVATMLMRLLSV